MDEMVTRVKHQAQSVTQQTKSVAEQAKSMVSSTPLAEVIPVTGRSKVQLPTPISANSGYFRFYAFDDGRPGVVQFTSYDPEKGPNDYPALLVRANTVEKTAGAVAGQVLMGRVFLQASSGSPVVTTPPDALVEVTISTANPAVKTVNASIGNAMLYDAKGRVINATGIIIEGVQP